MIKAKITKIWAKWCRICHTVPETDPVYRWLTGIKLPTASSNEWELKHPKEAKKMRKAYKKEMKRQGIVFESRKEARLRRLQQNIIRALTITSFLR